MKKSPLPRPQRRQFIAFSAASLGFSAAPLGLRGVHAWADEPGESTPAGSIGVCVVGVNGRGGSHIGGFLKDARTRIAALVDIDPKASGRRIQKIKETQGVAPKVFTDFRDALQDDSIDVVSCATPNHWHALMGVWAMQAGKDVYIEKPISHNIHEGRALVAASEAYNRVFQTGTQCRSSQAIEDAVRFIAEDGIGPCKFARGLCYKRRKSIGALGDYPIPDDVDFDLWSGPATFTSPKLTRRRFHYDWHWQRHYGNGDLGNQGPHQTDIARWGLALDRHPQRILTYGGRLGYQAERKDPNYVDAGDTANTEVSIYDYGDKTITFETRGLDVSESAGPEVDAMFGRGGGNKIGVIFYGEGGYVAQVSYNRAVAFDKAFRLIREFKTNDVNQRHFRNFIDAVVARDRSAVHADARVGHLSAAVSHLGNIAYYLGEKNRVALPEIESAVTKFGGLDDNALTLKQTAEHLAANGVELDQTPMSLGPVLQFDPDAERFVGNDAANGLLTREYRDGFEVPAAGAVKV